MRRSAGEAVTLTFADEVDVSRGDLLCAPHDRPEVADQFAAHLIWMGEEQLLPGRPYLMQIGTPHRAGQGHRDQAQASMSTRCEHRRRKTLSLNEIGRCNLAAGHAGRLRPLCREPRHRRASS